MKKTIILIAAACLAASGALAQQPQLEKGNIMLGVTSTIGLERIGGSELMHLGITRSKDRSGGTTYNEHDNTSFNLLPKSGYFIMNNLAVGLEAVIYRTTFKFVNSEGKYISTTFGVGPVVRYYYPLDKIYPFAEVEALFGSYVEKWPTSGGTTEQAKYPFFMAGASLGAAIPLGSKVTFDVMAGYLSTTWKNDVNASIEPTKEIISGLVIRMGLTVYL